MRHRTLIAIVVLGALAIAGVTTLRIREPASEHAGPVIATVRGRPIYLEEARARLHELRGFHGDGAQTDWQSLVLRSLADDVLLELAAQEMGITVATADIDRQIARLRSNFPSEERFREWLARQGMDEQELAARIRMQTLTVRVFARVTADVSVPPERVRNHYERRRDDYVAPTGEPIPFYAVRSEIREDLLRRAKERAYARWLEAERARADLVILMPDWFRRIS
jgi:hypothetical protein